MSMDAVFKALADPHRRRLLDRLFAEDGQTLGALERRMPMTRFGVMKHLKVLEEAGLIVTRKRGREKLHFLNAVPVRLIHDRWVSKYTAPVASALVEMKRDLEGERKMEKLYEIYIKTTPEKLWHAITDQKLRAKYNFGAVFTSTYKKGSKLEAHGGGMLIAEGVNVEVDPPRRLVQTFRPLWDEAVKKEPESRVIWEIEQVGDSCKLLVTHDKLRDKANPQLYGGWPMVLSGLKTLLETGELLTTPGSLRFQGPEAA